MGSLMGINLRDRGHNGTILRDVGHNGEIILRDMGTILRDMGSGVWDNLAR